MKFVDDDDDDDDDDDGPALKLMLHGYPQVQVVSIAVVRTLCNKTAAIKEIFSFTLVLLQLCGPLNTKPNVSKLCTLCSASATEPVNNPTKFKLLPFN